MHIDRASAEADRLNEFWDRLVDGNAGTDGSSERRLNRAGADTSPHHVMPSGAQRSRGISRRSGRSSNITHYPKSAAVLPAGHARPELEALVLYLESLKPLASSSQLITLRDTTTGRIERESRMHTVMSDRSDPLPVSASTPSARARSRIVPVVRAFDRFAAAALILAMVAALVLLGPVRDLLDGGEPSRFAAMLGFDEEPSEQQIGSQLSTSIDVRPGEYEDGTVEVGLWEVTLASGAAMSPAPASDDSRGEAISFSVSQGSVLFGGVETERSVEEGGSVGDLAGIDYVRNPNASPAHLLVLAPMPPNAGFPLTIGAWPPGGPTASPVDGEAVTETEPELLSSVELDDTAAFQYRVMLSMETATPQMDLGEFLFADHRADVLHSITLRSGQVMVSPDADLAATPRPQVILDDPGDTYTFLPEDQEYTWVSVLRSEPATVLALSVMPAADNFTLDQTLESIAPFWGEWTVPASGETHLAVRRLALQPGGTYSLPTSAGVLYHVASGTVDMHNSDSGNTVNVAAGGTVAQIPGTVLSFSNPGSAPVNVIQTLVFDGSLRSIVSDESATNGETALLVEQSGMLPAGEVSLMLRVSEYNGENDGGGASQGGQSLTLVTSADGEIQVSRLGGNAEVILADGGESYQPSLGENVRIGVGDSLLVQPGGGWDITGASGASSLGLALTVSPAGSHSEPATPAASPDATVPGSYELGGDADACDIAPLTTEHVNDIVATPSAKTAPLDRSLRNQDGGTSDSATTDGIVATLQAYTDCSATGDYARIYAFYSDQSIRESRTTQDLITAEHDFGEVPRVMTTVEDIVLFPDGRAGARIVIDGQPAYLTFVLEEGRWKIDVWDDSGSGRGPIATPAA